MKKLATFVLLAAILTGCSFSKGVKTDLTTGLTYSYNGFGIKDAVVLCNDSPVKGKTYPEGSILKIELHGVKNYTMEDEKAYPGCSILVTDEDGNVTLKNDDIFENVEITKEQLKLVVPSIKITFGNSFAAGKKYELKAHFYDKKKPESVIDIDLGFEVVAK